MTSAAAEHPRRIPLHPVLKHLKLQLSDYSQQNIVKVDRAEHLNHALFRQLINTLLELLRFQCVFDAYFGENLR